MTATDRPGATSTASPAFSRAMEELLPFVGVFRCDAQGNYILVNQHWCELAGLDPNQALGTGWMTALHPDDLASFLEDWDSTRDAGRKFERICRFRHWDSTVRRVQFRAVPERDDEGNVTGYAGVVIEPAGQSITESQAIRELREGEERLAHALASSGDGLVDWNIQTGAVFVNAQYYRMMGFKPGDFRAESDVFRNLCHPEDLTSTDALMEDYFQNRREEHEIEIRVRARDGRWRWLLSRGRLVARDELGRPLRMIISHVDITERKKTEAEWRLANFTVEDAPVGIFWWTADGRFQRVNRMACSMTGYTEEELLGISLFELDPSLAGVSAADLWARRKTAKQQTFEAAHRHKDGHVYPTEVYSSFLEFEGAEYVVSFVRDISERKRFEAQLRLASFTVENAPVGITWRTVDGRFRRANRAASSMSGYNRKELLGMAVTDLDVGVTPARLDSIWAGRRKTKTFESLHRHRDGHTYPVEIQASFMEFEGDAYVVAFVSDITERKRAESELRLAGFTVENAPVGILWSDAGGAFTRVSQTACAMNGYTAAELLSLRVQDLDATISPGDFPEVMTKIRTMRHRRFETRHRRKDGQTYPVEIYASFLRFEGADYVVSFVTDITERKKAEAELRLSSFTVANASVGIFWVNAEGEIKRVNQMACAMTGYEESELLRMRLGDVNPTRSPAGFAGILESLREENRRTFETRHQHKDGHTYPVEIYANFLSFEGTDYAVAFVTDITERKRAEAELRLTSFAVENASVGIFWRSVNGRFKRVNQMACRMTGYSEAELLSMSLTELDPMFSVADMDSLWSQLRGMKHQTCETWHRRKDGSVYPVDVYSSFLEFEGIEYVVSFARDVSDRKKAQEEKAIRAALVEASHDFIGMATLDGKVTYLNSAAKALVGLQDFETAGQITIYDFFPPDARESIMKVTIPELRGKGWVRQESQLRHFRTGRLIPVEIEAMTIRDAQGAAICLATVTRDLTERRAADRQRAALETQLAQSQKMEALGRLTGGIAHDFNNSLTVILGYAAMLAASDNLTAKQRDAARSIADAGTHSKHLVAQLLGFSRQQIIAPSLQDLNQVLVDYLPILSRLVGEEIELRTLSGEDLWKVMLDATQVDQVLMNLAANARDAMPDGGTLSLKTQNVVISDTDVHQNPAARPGEYVLLAISDNGTGMDSATVARIFEPFFTTKPRGKGTGLGLATVYGIVRQNQGFINVFSEPGRGTTFQVYFPRFVQTSPASSKGQETEALPRGKGTILLVEDDDLVRDMTADALRFLGYTPVIASSALEAIEICRDRTTRIDLVVSDVVMPNMGGMELRDALARIRPDLTVLFVSGHASDVIVRQGILKPGVQFLQKPFDYESLGTRIEKLLMETRRNGV